MESIFATAGKFIYTFNILQNPNADGSEILQFKLKHNQILLYETAEILKLK